MPESLKKRVDLALCGLQYVDSDICFNSCSKVPKASEWKWLICIPDYR